ncbi:hypothetical protein GYMLUDRAFT_67871 [Collybiopsis luxurians FD-317 M1]|nr:hypothetical protein GYMLUDRAFT_67871 [Collybiopsis luxurians FD-317 M1]
MIQAVDASTSHDEDTEKHHNLSQRVTIDVALFTEAKVSGSAKPPITPGSTSREAGILSYQSSNDSEESTVNDSICEELNQKEFSLFRMTSPELYVLNPFYSQASSLAHLIGANGDVPERPLRALPLPQTQHDLHLFAKSLPPGSLVGGNDVRARPRSLISDNLRLIEPAAQRSEVSWSVVVASFLSEIIPYNVGNHARTNYCVPFTVLDDNVDLNLIYIINPSSSSDSQRDRERVLLFLFFEDHLNLPAKPGDPGIIVTARGDIMKMGPLSFFMSYRKREKDHPCVWFYAGEYELEMCGKMSAEQFSKQPRKSQERWSKIALSQKLEGDLTLMRNRIQSRKYGIPFNPNESVSEKNSSPAIDAEHVHLDAQDVIDAFVNGDEHLSVIRMKCVDYDRTFVKDLKSGKDIWLQHPNVPQRALKPRQHTVHPDPQAIRLVDPQSLDH